jgi:hypothetical protein
MIAKQPVSMGAAAGWPAEVAIRLQRRAPPATPPDLRGELAVVFDRNHWYGVVSVHLPSGHRRM